MLSLRPASDSRALDRRVRAAGGRCWHLPTLRIVPRQDSALAAELARALQSDLLLFTSPNAVAAACAALPAAPWKPAVLAVGSGSAAALRKRGVECDWPQRMDSEGLLAMPALNPPPSRIALITGVGGRNLLQPALQARGAEVQRIDVYARQPQPPSDRQRKRLQALHEPVALLLSSAEALDVLLADPRIAALARIWQPVAASARLAVRAAECGLQPAWQAASAAPEALLATLCQHAKATPIR